MISWKDVQFLWCIPVTRFILDEARAPEETSLYCPLWTLAGFLFLGGTFSLFWLWKINNSLWSVQVWKNRVTVERGSRGGHYGCQFLWFTLSYSYLAAGSYPHLPNSLNPQPPPHTSPISHLCLLLLFWWFFFWDRILHTAQASPKVMIHLLQLPRDWRVQASATSGGGEIIPSLALCILFLLSWGPFGHCKVTFPCLAFRFCSHFQVLASFCVPLVFKHPKKLIW